MHYTFFSVYFTWQDSEEAAVVEEVCFHELLEASSAERCPFRVHLQGWSKHRAHAENKEEW